MILNEFTKKNMSKFQEMLAARKCYKAAMKSLTLAKEHLKRTQIALVNAIDQDQDFDHLSDLDDDDQSVTPPKK